MVLIRKILIDKIRKVTETIIKTTKMTEITIEEVDIIMIEEEDKTIEDIIMMIDDDRIKNYFRFLWKNFMYKKYSK